MTTAALPVVPTRQPPWPWEGAERRSWLGDEFLLSTDLLKGQSQPTTPGVSPDNEVFNLGGVCSGLCVCNGKDKYYNIRSRGIQRRRRQKNNELAKLEARGVVEPGCALDIKRLLRTPWCLSNSTNLSRDRHHDIGRETRRISGMYSENVKQYFSGCVPVDEKYGMVCTLVYGSVPNPVRAGFWRLHVRPHARVGRSVDLPRLIQTLASIRKP